MCLLISFTLLYSIGGEARRGEGTSITSTGVEMCVNLFYSPPVNLGGDDMCPTYSGRKDGLEMK